MGKELSAKIYFGPEFVTSSKTFNKPKSGSVLLSKNVRTMTHAATKPAGWF